MMHHGQIMGEAKKQQRTNVGGGIYKFCNKMQYASLA